MDHRIKLSWARQHLAALRDEMRAFAERKPYGMTVKFDAVREKHIVSLRVLEGLPDHFASRVGDIVHNVRSALDTLTYGLSCKALGRVPTGQEVKQIQFVIVDSNADWRGECGRRLRYLAPEAKAAIERMQPYNNRPHATFVHVLSILRNLSNIDKHRHLIVVGHAAMDASVTVWAPGQPQGDVLVGTFGGWSGPFQDNQEIGAFDFAERYSDRVLALEEQPQVRLNGEITIDMAFGDGHPGYGDSASLFCAGARATKAVSA